MAYEVKPAVEKTTENLNEMSQEDLDSAISSFLHKYTINENGTITSIYPKSGDERRKPKNREFIEVEFESMKNIGDEAMKSCLSSQIKINRFARSAA